MIEATGIKPAAGRPPQDEPSAPATSPSGTPADPMAELLRGLGERLGRIEAGLEDVRRAVVEKPPTKEWYSVDEAARLLGRSKLTIREHCRFGRIAAKKRPAGRGATSEWAIAHAELVRVQNEGLIALAKHVPDRP